jgi:hypothetical protein
MKSDEPDVPIVCEKSKAISAARRRLMSFIEAESVELGNEWVGEFLGYAIAELLLLKREIEEDGVVQLVEKLDENGTAKHEVKPVETLEADLIPFDAGGLL